MQGEQDRACLSRHRWIHKPGGQVRGLSWSARGHQPLGTGKNRRSTACTPEHTSRKRSRGTRKGGGETAAGENPESVARWEDSISRKKGAACGKYFRCIKYRKGWTWTTGISNKICSHLDENSFDGVVVAKAWLDEFKDMRREQYYRECRKYFGKFT